MVRARGIEELGTQQRGGRFLFWDGDVRGTSLMGLRLFRAWPYRACVLIQVFTGTVPFSGKPETAAVFEIMNGDRPPRPTHPTIAERLWSLMKLCWDNEPHLRPEISKALETLLAASASCLFCDYRVFGLTVVFCTVTSQRRVD